MRWFVRVRGLFGKCVLLFSSILFGLLCFAPSTIYAISPSDELQRIQQEIEANKAKINEAKKKEQEYLKQLGAIEDKLNAAQDELDSLESQMATLTAEVQQTESELKEKQEELSAMESALDEKTQLLNARVREMYMNGNMSFLEVVFESKDLSELLRQWVMMNKVAEQDVQTIREIREMREAINEQKKEVEDKKESLLSEKENLQRLIEAAENKKREIQQTYDEKASLLAQSKADRQKLEAINRQLEERSRQIQAQLAAMSGGAAPGGRFGWPTRGVVTSGFGMRWGRMHEGIDISGSIGQAVYAAESGQVVDVNYGYGGGYGNYVIIYHGGGFSTLYAHLSKIAVRPGASVKRGQLIGYVGSTGYSFGPHLHFEVRVNGVPRNPMGYL